MEDKNKPLFDVDKLKELFYEAIKNSKDNPDLDLPPSTYLDENKVLRKTKRK